MRARLIAGGRGKFRAWNNATEFCEPGTLPPGMCIADFETEPACVLSPAGTADPFANRFPVGLDRIPFFDCFAASPGDESSNGISDHPDFPDKLAEVGFPFAGWHGDPGFVNAQPRVMKTSWRTSDGAVQLEIAFSTPIQDPPSDTHVALRLEAGGTVGSAPCQKVRTTALDCRFPGLAAAPPMTATLLLPRSIRSPGGKPVTLWAATVSNIGFQP